MGRHYSSRKFIMVILEYKDPDQQREYQRQWIARRRADFFNGKSCVKCGATEQLELDHVDPRTKIHHAIWSWSKERRDAEILKCQVLCNDCHKKKSSIDILRTHCVYGHEMTVENTQIRKTKEGWRERRCRICRRAAEVKRRLKKKLGNLSP